MDIGRTVQALNKADRHVAQMRAAGDADEFGAAFDAAVMQIRAAQEKLIADVKVSLEGGRQTTFSHWAKRRYQTQADPVVAWIWEARGEIFHAEQRQPHGPLTHGTSIGELHLQKPADGPAPLVEIYPDGVWTVYDKGTARERREKVEPGQPHVKTANLSTDVHVTHPPTSCRSIALATDSPVELLEVAIGYWRTEIEDLQRQWA